MSGILAVFKMTDVVGFSLNIVVFFIGILMIHDTFCLRLFLISKIFMLFTLKKLSEKKKNSTSTQIQKKINYRRQIVQLVVNFLCQCCNTNLLSYQTQEMSEKMKWLFVTT